MSVIEFLKDISLKVLEKVKEKVPNFIGSLRRFFLVQLCIYLLIFF